MSGDQTISLSDVQASLKICRSLPEVAEDIRRLSAQLVLVTAVEDSSQARNLVSAELLSEILLQICYYSQARGWNVDRLVVRAATLGRQALPAPSAAIVP